MLIVIHGTVWIPGNWWHPNQPFTNYLNTVSIRQLYTGPNPPFSWSGGNSDAARQAGASLLVNWVQQNPAPDSLFIVAHSHGGNVAMLASRQGVKIDRLINLGTPITTQYTPDLRNINLIRNVYSFGDPVQTPFGSAPHTRGEGRSLGDSDKLLNVLAHNGGLFGLGPSHSALHTPTVWTANNFDKFLSNTP